MIKEAGGAPSGKPTGASIKSNAFIRNESEHPTGPEEGSAESTGISDGKQRTVSFLENPTLTPHQTGSMISQFQDSPVVLADDPC
jgi:hypothetical protein